MHQKENRLSSETYLKDKIHKKLGKKAQFLVYVECCINFSP